MLKYHLESVLKVQLKLLLSSKKRFLLLAFLVFPMSFIKTHPTHLMMMCSWFASTCKHIGFTGNTGDKRELTNSTVKEVSTVQKHCSCVEVKRMPWIQKYVHVCSLCTKNTDANPVKFSQEPDISHPECQQLLSKSWPEFDKSPKMTQKLFVKYICHLCI